MAAAAAELWHRRKKFTPANWWLGGRKPTLKAAIGASSNTTAVRLSTAARKKEHY